LFAHGGPEGPHYSDAAIVKRHYGVKDEGNAPVDPQQEFVGKNLLYVAEPVPGLATAFGIDEAVVEDILARARLDMFAARLTRPRPHLDDKVLTAWNGLMIAAFARTGRVKQGRGQDGRQYIEAAQRAAAFIRTRMWDPASGILLRRFRDGQAGIDAYAEDYAYLIFGLLELFQADPAPDWLTWAVALQERQNERFWDGADGGWFHTGKDPTVLVRMKEDYDGAEPTPARWRCSTPGAVPSVRGARRRVVRDDRENAAPLLTSWNRPGGRADDGGGAIGLRSWPAAGRGGRGGRGRRAGSRRRGALPAVRHDPHSVGRAPQPHRRRAAARRLDEAGERRARRIRRPQFHVRAAGDECGRIGAGAEVMTVPVEICLKGDDYATNETIAGIAREPRAWTDADVRLVLEGMLQAMHRRKHPEGADQSVSLRGLSWIVNPFEAGGVVIAIEITLGVAVAGPFDIDQARLEAMIDRVLLAPAGPSSLRVH
jgi:hypothetical protein